MDLRSLRYFVAVVEVGSLTRAAGSLFVAQPALTAQIKRLESEFGVQLLERSRSGVKPTAAGLQLYQESMRLLADADALRARVGKPAGEPEGSVSMAFPVLLVSTLLGQVLLRVRERYPRIRVHVIDDVSVGTEAAVHDGRADFGLLVDPPANAGLSVHAVAAESIYFSGLDRSGQVRRLLRRPPARRGRSAGAPPDPTIRFADAASQPLVLQSRRFVIRRQAQQAAAQAGVTLNVVHEYDSANAIRALSRIGAAFTFTPACAAFRPSDDPAVVRARIVEPEMVRTYSLAWLTGRTHSDAARAVIAAIRAEIGAAISQGRWSARHVDRPDHQLD
jgi:DNA-binding transcriptional LysR family regulator